MDQSLYLVALGSNMRHPQHGQPRRVMAAALEALRDESLDVLAGSRTIETPPLGPSRRRYANAVAIVDTLLDPDDVLTTLHRIEQNFGRKRRGAAWGARVLDLDLILWSGGPWASSSADGDCIVPHPAFRDRRFVLAPAASIAGEWQDPLTGLNIRQLLARLTKPRTAPR